MSGNDPIDDYFSVATNEKPAAAEKPAGGVNIGADGRPVVPGAKHLASTWVDANGNSPVPNAAIPTGAPRSGGNSNSKSSQNKGSEVKRMDLAPTPSPITPAMEPIPSDPPKSSEKNALVKPQQVPAPQDSPPAPGPGPKGSDLMQMILADLEDIECYHGAILDEDIKMVLNKNGDFMIRMVTEPDGSKQVILSIILSNELIDLPIRAKQYPVLGVVPERKELQFTLDNRTRGANIKDLIRKHTTMSIPVLYKKKEVYLMNPIAKQSWELRHDNVELITKLGEGAFGEVYSGKLKLPLKKFCNVAVKVIKRTSTSDQATKDLQKEAAIMRKFKHNNIVRFYGIVIKKDKIMVVMELINGGGLDSYLKKHLDAPVEERAAYASDIACGLAYLHAQGVVHRDIACRNVLLDLYRKIAKVSDFGLARVADEVKLRPDERIPIRWTAPEVVKTFVYTRAADTYAYAILVYEIFSNAAMPFLGFTNAQIKEGIQKDDFRPKFPATTPPEIVQIVSKCWLSDPLQRPQLFEVARQLTAYTGKKAEPEPNFKMKRAAGASQEKVNKDKLRAAKQNTNPRNARSRMESKKAGTPRAASREKTQVRRPAGANKGSRETHSSKR